MNLLDICFKIISKMEKRASHKRRIQKANTSMKRSSNLLILGSTNKKPCEIKFPTFRVGKN